MRAVARAKQIKVVQHVVELIEGNAFRCTGFQWPYLFIRFVETGVESSKESGHGKFCFSATVIRGGVNQHGVTTLVV